jgi:hypothetical protein
MRGTERRTVLFELDVLRQTSHVWLTNYVRTVAQRKAKCARLHEERLKGETLVKNPIVLLLEKLLSEVRGLRKDLKR